MIRSFKDSATEKTFNDEYARRIPAEIVNRARRKLELLDAATSLQDLGDVPGNNLEALAGDREAQHSIRINRQWRICFVWTEGSVDDVEIVDYHKG